MTISLRRLVAVELAKLWRERMVRGALLVFAVTSVAALTVGWSRAQTDRHTISAIQREEDERYAKIASDIDHARYIKTPFGDLTSPGLVGVTVGARSVALPPGDLSVLAVGQRDVVPVAARVTMRLDPLTERCDALVNPRTLLIGPFDFAFVIVYVFPLLVFVLGYDLVSSERELGTLPLLLSQPTSFSRILFSKIIARLLALMVLVCALFCAVLPLSAAALSTMTLLRLLSAMAAVSLYGAFWFALALVVQRLGRSSQTNALILLATWLLFVVVLPTSLDFAAKALAPLPSRVRLFEANRDAQREAGKIEDQSLNQYYGDHPEFASAAAHYGYWTHWVARTRAVEKAVQPLQREFALQLARQQAIVDQVGAISPAVTVNQTLTEIAGSDPERDRSFIEQVDAFSLAFRAFFEERSLHGQALVATDIALVPRFEFREKTPDGSLARHTLSRLFAGLVPLLLCLSSAFVGLRRTRWLERREDD